MRFSVRCFTRQFDNGPFSRVYCRCVVDSRRRVSPSYLPVRRQSFSCRLCPPVDLLSTRASILYNRSGPSNYSRHSGIFLIPFETYDDESLYQKRHPATHTYLSGRESSPQERGRRGTTLPLHLPGGRTERYVSRDALGPNSRTSHSSVPPVHASPFETIFPT